MRFETLSEILLLYEYYYLSQHALPVFLSDAQTPKFFFSIHYDILHFKSMT